MSFELILESRLATVALKAAIRVESPLKVEAETPFRLVVRDTGAWEVLGTLCFCGLQHLQPVVHFHCFCKLSMLKLVAPPELLHPMLKEVWSVSEIHGHHSGQIVLSPLHSSPEPQSEESVHHPPESMHPL